MKRLQAVFFSSSERRALFEGGLGLLPALLLGFSVIDQIPAINIPATIFFLIQFPLGWAALRLRFEPAFTWRGVLRELGRGGVLRLISLTLVVVLGAVFHLQTLLVHRDFDFPYPVVLLLYSATCLPWMFYRLFFCGLRTWMAFTRKSLLWTLVNSYLAAVIVVVTLVSFSSWTLNLFQPSNAEWPDNLLAILVLELVRGIIPWVGVNFIFLFFLLMVILPPAIFLSYLTARHFVKRIQGLAQAMHGARGGDLSVRVIPGGTDEVTQLQEDFNQMAADLQRERDKVNSLLANQRELAAVISHELRTPLTVMRVTIESELEKENSAIEMQDLAVLHQETLHLQSLVEDLFTLSLLDTQKLDLACAWHEPTALVQACLAALQPLAWKNKRIELTCALPAGLPRVWTDGQRLTQVLSNLVQNAIRHTPEGGVIVLQGRCLGEQRVELAVCDSGEGINAQELPHIWERYYHGKNRSGGRTGIGLSLVKELVEAMGGAVGAESEPGKGSRFWLQLRSEDFSG